MARIDLRWLKARGAPVGKAVVTGTDESLELGDPSGGGGVTIEDVQGAIDTALADIDNRLIPAGGVSGQVLAKNTDIDYDVGYQDVQGGGGPAAAGVRVARTETVGSGLSGVESLIVSTLSIVAASGSTDWWLKTTVFVQNTGSTSVLLTLKIHDSSLLVEVQELLPGTTLYVEVPYSYDLYCTGQCSWKCVAELLDWDGGKAGVDRKVVHLAGNSSTLVDIFSLEAWKAVVVDTNDYWLETEIKVQAMSEDGVVLVLVVDGIEYPEIYVSQGLPSIFAMSWDSWVLRVMGTYDVTITLTLISE